MHSTLALALTVAILAATSAAQDRNPTLRTEDLPPGEPSSNSVADITLLELVRDPDRYLDGVHILDGVRIHAPRNHTRAFAIEDPRDAVMIPRGPLVCSGPESLRQAMRDNPELARLDARIRFVLEPALGGRYLALVASSIEFLDETGQVVQTVR